MKINLPSGKYVVAVSGGVDSVVLLDTLVKQPELSLTVAHLDHGIRKDSLEDRRHVQKLAAQHGVPFVYHKAKLGAQASEAVARATRYDFLHSVRRASGAKAIITAHHQDDVLETLVLNVLRGTGRRGLSSLRSTQYIKRPLLETSKEQLRRYALDQKLVWREDSTNSDERYLRNYIRLRLLPKLGVAGKKRLLVIAAKAVTINDALDTELESLLAAETTVTELRRHTFIMLPHAVAKELMATWLRRQPNIELTKLLLERLVVAGKTGRVGSRVDINKNHIIIVTKTKLALTTRER